MGCTQFTACSLCLGSKHSRPQCILEQSDFRSIQMSPSFQCNLLHFICSTCSKSPLHLTARRHPHQLPPPHTHTQLKSLLSLGEQLPDKCQAAEGVSPAAASVSLAAPQAVSLAVLKWPEGQAELSSPHALRWPPSFCLDVSETRKRLA